MRRQRLVRLFGGVCVSALAACLVLAAGGVKARAENPEVAAVIPLRELPPEAQETLNLIRNGGPFPYARDGIVFGNREGLLPRAPRGSYREYTVRTPGSRDRGARRIVKSDKGEFYYTADHYRSFRRILK